MIINDSVLQRFWQRVIKSQEPNGCWLWNGALFRDSGYGQFTLGNHPVRTHRLSWVIHFGPIPDGMCVLHRCDCRLCVRPDHIWLGTQRQNVDDMLAKGRSLIGERNHKAKVTARQVIEIRSLFHSGSFTQQSLADQFGLKQPQISSIVLHKSWRHLSQGAPDHQTGAPLTATNQLKIRHLADFPEFPVD